MFDSRFVADKKHFIGNNYYEAVVIGANFSGIFASQQAWRGLPKKTKIALIDSNGLLSSESFNRNEYVNLIELDSIRDRAIAEACLRNAVEIAHAFDDLILDEDNPNAPSRRCRHYLVNNVDSPSVEYVKAECENLKRLYAELLVDYPNAENVFGPPENFITYLTPEQYLYDAPSIPFEKMDGAIEGGSVGLGIEISECHINVTRFKKYFEYVFVYLRDRLKLFDEHTVVRVSHAQEFLGYEVEICHFDRKTGPTVNEILFTKAVINCTRGNIDGIGSDLNYHHEGYKPQASYAATVPPDLFGASTCVFFSGPHVSPIRSPGASFLQMQAGMKIAHSYKFSRELVELMYRRLIIRQVFEEIFQKVIVSLETGDGRKNHKIHSALQYSLRTNLLSRLPKEELTHHEIPTEQLKEILKPWAHGLAETMIFNYAAQLESDKLVFCP